MQISEDKDGSSVPDLDARNMRHARTNYIDQK